MNRRHFILSIFCLLVIPFLMAKSGANQTKDIRSFLLPPPGNTVIYDTVSIASGEIKTRCLDTTGLTGPVDTIYNACPQTFANAVSFALIPSTKCIKYTGVSCGNDTACIVMCDAFGICDTITLIVSALDPDCFPTKSTVYDTLFVNTDKNYLVDLGELNGNLTDLRNDCPASSGQSIVFSLQPNSLSVNYAAIAIGTDTACIVVQDDRGFQDTTCLIITAIVPQTEIICDTLTLGTQRLYCLVNDEIGGTIQSLENVCPGLSGNSVILDVNPVTICFNARTIALGTDTVCMVICNEDDVCDTTIFKLTVIESDDTTGLEPPIAVNDTTTTIRNSNKVINVLANDTIPGGPVILEVIGGPQNGLAVVNPDFTIQYIPGNNFCGLDSFVYRVCNTVGCDTATVYIDVDCITDPFFIFNGISPDEDGVNDTWTIQGIENFPNNRVRVYSRWGNLVFDVKGYRNQWDGKWEGKDLPDGTYFYLIDLGNGQLFKGFLQINR